jgi:hypothetical protein
VERTIMLIEQRALQIPEGTDVMTFILSGGQAAKPVAAEPAAESTKAKPIVAEHSVRRAAWPEDIQLAWGAAGIGGFDLVVGAVRSRRGSVGLCRGWIGRVVSASFFSGVG